MFLQISLVLVQDYKQNKYSNSTSDNMMNNLITRTRNIIRLWPI